jgi:hypothetical protein
MGAINVPANRYWGAQTQRSLIHFSIGDDRMPKADYHAYGYVKKAAAAVTSFKMPTSPPPRKRPDVKSLKGDQAGCGGWPAAQHQACEHDRACTSRTAFPCTMSYSRKDTPCPWFVLM